MTANVEAIAASRPQVLMAGIVPTIYEPEMMDM
jgi:hypothetical protein